MSGSIVHRVNRIWDRTQQANISAAVFMWEWLKYVEGHTKLDWIAYGTGGTQSGTTPPSSWLDWDPTSEAVPWSDNSWFVFQATDASELLNGSGSQPWQCKIQSTLATGFDDSSGSDYGFEASTYIACFRVSPDGGWDSGTLDFDPGSGAAASNNMRAYQGQDEHFGLDIVGDIDTVVWRGYAGDTADYSKERGGYIGMFNRRSPAIEKPFFATIGAIADTASGAGDLNRFCKDLTGNFQPETVLQWPSFSLGPDGLSAITAHNHNTYNVETANRMRTYHYTSEDMLYRMVLYQWQSPNDYSLLGEYLLLVSCGSDKAPGTVFGENSDWIQVGYDSANYGGIGMKWPTGESPIW